MATERIDFPMHLRSYRAFARTMVFGSLLAVVALPAIASAQSYSSTYSGYAETYPTYGGGSTTYYSNGVSAQTYPTYGGGYSTYYSDGGYASSTPTYGGGYSTYYTAPTYGYPYP